jgi:hypothetical protein
VQIEVELDEDPDALGVRVCAAAQCCSGLVLTGAALMSASAMPVQAEPASTVDQQGQRRAALFYLRRHRRKSAPSPIPIASFAPAA